MQQDAVSEKVVAPFGLFLEIEALAGVMGLWYLVPFGAPLSFWRVSRYAMRIQAGGSGKQAAGSKLLVSYTIQCMTLSARRRHVDAAENTGPQPTHTNDVDPF